MSDVTIPEDVQKIAEALSLKYGDELWTSELTAEIARVILAERERAAKIADEYAKVSDLHNFSHGLTRLEAERQSTAMEIAQAIRSSHD